MHPDPTANIGQIEDAILGETVSLTLNVPYRTLAQAGRLARADEALAFAKQLNTTHAKITDSQIHCAPFAGSSLYLMLNEALRGAEIPRGTRHVLAPLDNALYLADWSEDLGVLEIGSERILSDGSEMELIAGGRTLVIDCGARSSEFSHCLTQISVAANDLKAFRLAPLLLELPRNGLFPRALLLRAAGAAAIAAAGVFALSILLAPEPPPAPIPVDAGPPMGVDLAARQLAYLQSMFPELDYFADKHPLNFTYAPGAGVTIAGSLPSASVMQRFTDDAAQAGLPLAFSAGGWRVTAPDANHEATPFPLKPFADNLVAFQIAAETLGFSFTFTEPVLSIDRHATDIALTLPAPGYPEFSGLAESLRNRAVSVTGFQMTWGESVLPQSASLTLQLTGLPP